MQFYANSNQSEFMKYANMPHRGMMLKNSIPVAGLICNSDLRSHLNDSREQREPAGD